MLCCLRGELEVLACASPLWALSSARGPRARALLFLKVQHVVVWDATDTGCTGTAELLDLTQCRHNSAYARAQWRMFWLRP